MSDQPSLPVTADFAPFNEADYAPAIAQGVTDIESAGARVTAVHFTAPDVPPKFSIQFVGDQPQWKTRDRLNTLLYDVGQSLGQKNLSFYATKRTEKTRGWAT